MGEGLSLGPVQDEAMKQVAGCQVERVVSGGQEGGRARAWRDLKPHGHRGAPISWARLRHGKVGGMPGEIPGVAQPTLGNMTTPPGPLLLGE